MKPKTTNRTIRIAVAEVIEGGSKQQFYADLRNSLDIARRAANKTVSLCVAADTELMTGGKCPKLYTYHGVASAFPGAKSIASSIARAAESKYKQERRQVAAGRKSICNYRSMPWALLCNATGKTLAVEDRGEYLTARMRLLGGWWTVRLAGGSNYRDQVSGIRRALSEGKIGDSKIWTDRKHKAILGLSVSLPAAEKMNGGTLSVVTMRDEFITATKARTDTPFVITGDQLKSWIFERDRKYQRLRQDRKSGVSRSRLNAVLRRNGDKWKNRVSTWIHEATAKIVAHAKRRNCGAITLDMTIKSFMPKFPYYEFATKLAYKCEDAGIEFADATQAIAEPDMSKPHVYFKYSPSTNRVKIGETTRTDGGRHRPETDSPEELVILAIDNQPKSKTRQREKRYHAKFASARLKGEWFDGEPVIHFLREAGWLGNAGNLSQIAQVLPLEEVPAESASSRPERERAVGNDPAECSRMRVKGEDMHGSTMPALAVTE